MSALISPKLKSEPGETSGPPLKPNPKEANPAIKPFAKNVGPPESPGAPFTSSAPKPKSEGNPKKV